MEEDLEGLDTLDPASAESLKIVAYFDALLESGAEHDSLLRGAAVLSGVVAGSERQGHVVRFNPVGQRVHGAGEASGPIRRVGGGSVWLEREGPLQANDRIIVERLGHAVTLLDVRRDLSGGFAVAIDASRSMEERSAVLAQLRIEPSAQVRLIATTPERSRNRAISAVVPTRYGILQATLETPGEPLHVTRAGLGQWTRADHAPDSWDDAVIAYRLSTDDLPVLEAAEIGALLDLIRDYHPATPHRDVTVLSSLDHRMTEVLRVLVEEESIRSAAVALNLHHSTLQAKHRQLCDVLGYDPRTPGGRARFIIAEVLHRLQPDP